MPNQEGYKKLISKVLQVSEKDVLPLRYNDIGMIDVILARLDSRSAEILRCHFGLFGRERQVLRIIGREFGVRGQRIQQIEGRALAKLRHPSRIGDFLRFTQAGLKKQLRMKEVPLGKRGIEDFELSTRTLNCLKYCGINTIGELTAKTEREMLMLPNFGQKSLFELRCLLKSLELDFAPDERHRR